MRTLQTADLDFATNTLDVTGFLDQPGMKAILDKEEVFPEVDNEKTLIITRPEQKKEVAPPEKNTVPSQQMIAIE